MSQSINPGKLLIYHRPSFNEVIHKTHLDMKNHLTKLMIKAIN
jgi:hypothetical protein